MKKGLLVSVALIMSLSSFLSAEFVARKNKISLHVYDFSVRQQSKLIGSMLGARTIQELNFNDIYPILIDIRNRSDQAFTINSGSVSIPTHSLEYMNSHVPKHTFRSIATTVAGCYSILFSTLGAMLLTHHYKKEGFSSFQKAMEKRAIRYGVPASIISLLMGWYLIYDGAVQLDMRSRDQFEWLSDWMLLPELTEIKPHTKVQAFIFVDKKTYQRGGFTLELYGDDNLVFDVSLLP